MRKRNHPISGWLLTKPAEEQTALLAKARQIAPRIREVDNHKHLIVLEELNDAMVEQDRARAAREVKQQQTKQTLMADVETLGRCLQIEGGCGQPVSQLYNKNRENKCSESTMPLLQGVF